MSPSRGLGYVYNIHVITLAQGIWWFAKNNPKLSTYIGMREFEKIIMKGMKDDKKYN